MRRSFPPLARALSLGLGLALCGCPPDDRPPPPDDPDAGPGVPLWPAGTLELGTSHSSREYPPRFVALPAELELQPGAQGGFHVPLMYRVQGHSQASAQFIQRVRRTRDGVLVSLGQREFDIAPDGGAWDSEGEVLIFMCPTPVGVSVLDEDLTFEVSVSRPSGTLLARTSAKLRLRCPAASSFCQSICKG